MRRRSFAEAFANLKVLPLSRSSHVRLCGELVERNSFEVLLLDGSSDLEFSPAASLQSLRPTSFLENSQSRAECVNYCHSEQ